MVVSGHNRYYGIRYEVFCFSYDDVDPKPKWSYEVLRLVMNLRVIY